MQSVHKVVWLLQDARKKLGAFIDTTEVAVTEAADRRLSSSACATLLRNYILACLPSSSTPKSSADGSVSSANLQRAAQAAAEAAPDSEAAMLLHAATAGLLGSADAGVRVIQAWLDSHSGSDQTTALLLGSHLACCGSAPNLTLGLELLSHDSLPGHVRHACAVVATRAAMHEKLLGEEAVGVLQQEAEAATQFWQGQPASDEQAATLVACIEHQVTLCLRQGTPEAALQRLRDVQVPVFKPHLYHANVAGVLLHCIAEPLALVKHAQPMCQSVLHRIQVALCGTACMHEWLVMLSPKLRIALVTTKRYEWGHSRWRLRGGTLCAELRSSGKQAGSARTAAAVPGRNRHPRSASGGCRCRR
jgi:hypothetical protein